MADKRDLALNDLSRYKKTSNRLVLEDYSHCEVPAGCGGGILRWIDPQTSLPLKVWLWSNGKATMFFDGAEIQSPRVDVRTGAHVLGIHLASTEDRPPQVVVVLFHKDDPSGAGIDGPVRTGPHVPEVSLRSGSNLRIVATLDEPQGPWSTPTFDDAGWTEMRPAEPVGARPHDWHLEGARRAGGHVIGLPKSAAAAWIRCTFELTLGGAL